MTPPLSPPPATSTLPLCSSVAVCWFRPTLRLPVNSHWPGIAAHGCASHNAAVRARSWNARRCPIFERLTRLLVINDSEVFISCGSAWQSCTWVNVPSASELIFGCHVCLGLAFWGQLEDHRKRQVIAIATGIADLPGVVSRDNSRAFGETVEVAGDRRRCRVVD